MGLPECFRAACLIGPRQIEMRDLVLPKPGPGEMIVRIAVATTCGTDLKVFERARSRDHPFGFGVVAPIDHGNQLCESSFPARKPATKGSQLWTMFRLPSSRRHPQVLLRIFPPPSFDAPGRVDAEFGSMGSLPNTNLVLAETITRPLVKRVVINRHRFAPRVTDVMSIWF